MQDSDPDTLLTELFQPLLTVMIFFYPYGYHTDMFYSYCCLLLFSQPVRFLRERKRESDREFVTVGMYVPICACMCLYDLRKHTGLYVFKLTPLNIFFPEDELEPNLSSSRCI